jgi:hypothetical protein
MRSYIDNRGVYHRFIDWGKIFGRKKDTEETAEEAAEIQEPVDTPQCLDDTDNAAPTVSDECNDDCPLEERVDDALLDGEPVDECNDDCPCEEPYVYEEPITIAEEVVEPQGVVETSTESVLLEEDLKEEMPAEMPAENNEQLVDKTNTAKSKKTEKVVKEKSTAKKTTTKKTTAKSSKSKK